MLNFYPKIVLDYTQTIANCQTNVKAWIKKINFTCHFNYKVQIRWIAIFYQRVTCGFMQQRNIKETG